MGGRPEPFQSRLIAVDVSSTVVREIPNTARRSSPSLSSLAKAKYAATYGDVVQSRRGVARPLCCPSAHQSFSFVIGGGVKPRRPRAAYLNLERCSDRMWGWVSLFARWSILSRVGCNSHVAAHWPRQTK